ncbi:MAG: hypothetical protein HOP15_13060 [Planctomycetes bacterium]|nr:hypothetical protein [Planctomycetota bacterium]
MTGNAAARYSGGASSASEATTGFGRMQRSTRAPCWAARDVAQVRARGLRAALEVVLKAVRDAQAAMVGLERFGAREQALHAAQEARCLPRARAFEFSRARARPAAKSQQESLELACRTRARRRAFLGQRQLELVLGRVLEHALDARTGAQVNAREEAQGEAGGGQRLGHLHRDAG